MHDGDEEVAECCQQVKDAEVDEQSVALGSQMLVAAIGNNHHDVANECHQGEGHTDCVADYMQY